MVMVSVVCTLKQQSLHFSEKRGRTALAPKRYIQTRALEKFQMRKKKVH